MADDICCAQYYQWRTENEIYEELNFLNLLKDHGISVSYPVKDSSEKYIQTIEAPEGTRYGVLFSYAKGDKIRNLSEKQCHELGMLLGRIHEISYEKTARRMVYDEKTLTQLPYQYALEYFPESMEEMQFVKHTSELIATEFQNVDTSQIRRGRLRCIRHRTKIKNPHNPLFFSLL